MGQPGSGGYVWGATYVLECAGVQALASSAGGTTRLAAEATRGDWVTGRSVVCGVVATANIMMPAAAAADTMPLQCATRTVQGGTGRSTVRLRTSPQLAAD